MATWLRLTYANDAATAPLCRAGAPVKKLAHGASLQAVEKITLSSPGSNIQQNPKIRDGLLNDGGSRG